MRKRIKEICDFVSRGSAPAYVDVSGNKVMNQATFSKGWIDESNIRFSSKAEDAANIHHGDLLMASTGGGVLGKIVYFDKLDENFYADSHVTIMRNSKNKNSMKFLYYYFYTRYNEINATMAKGSTNQTELQRNSLLAYEIDIPDFETQLRIVNYLDSKTAAIDSQISVLEKKRDAYERLKQSVINRAVTRGLEEDVPLKPSGVDWIGMIPEHWERKRLKDVSYMYGGLSGKSGDDFRCDDESLTKPFIPFTNILNNNVVDLHKVGSVVMKKGEEQNKVEQYDLLFLMSSEDYESIAKCAVVLGVPGETYLNSFCKGLRITSNEAIAPFINYQLTASACRDSLRFEARGFTRINIKIDKITSQFIILPPLSEQQEIVRYLDGKCAEIDRAIENTTKQIDAYKRLRRSLINEVVTGQRAV